MTTSFPLSHKIRARRGCCPLHKRFLGLASDEKTKQQRAKSLATMKLSSSNNEAVSLTQVVVTSAIFSAGFSALFTGIAVSHFRHAIFSSSHLQSHHHFQPLRLGESLVVTEGIGPGIYELGENYSTIVDGSDTGSSRNIRRERVLMPLGRKVADGDPDTIFACSKEDGDKVRFVNSLNDCTKKEIGHTWSTLGGEAGTFFFPGI